jgi:hypothetical protein
VPLLDHFHPPLSVGRHWESFHARWAAAMADGLNASVLPPGYFAEMQVHIGSRVEVDVATFENGDPVAAAPAGARAATLPAPAWAPPAPALILSASFPDELEVQVFADEGGPTLVAAVELVSPGNKDRAETRRAFAVKCVAYLQQGVGLVVVDVVTSRQADLHDEIARLLGNGGSPAIAGPSGLSAVAYRPARREAGDQIDVWPSVLAVGQALPTVPLALRGAGLVPLDLEASYTEARQRSRLG